MNPSTLPVPIFNNFKKNSEEHVYTENGEHYIFYAEESEINQFSISADLTISDIIFFGYTIGSKLQVKYAIVSITNYTDIPSCEYQLELVISNYKITTYDSDHFYDSQGANIRDSALRRILHIAGKSVKYTLSALNYIPLGTDINMWLI